MPAAEAKVLKHHLWQAALGHIAGADNTGAHSGVPSKACARSVRQKMQRAAYELLRREDTKLGDVELTRAVDTSATRLNI